jgi:TPR repeat protein
VIFDYFQAKKLFQKSLKKDTSPAAYGLAQIYFRKDNPFHSLDSAYKYIGIAKSTREKVKLKTVASRIFPAERP